MFVVHIDGYGDYTSQRDIVGTKSVAEERFRGTGRKLRDVKPGLCSITEYGNGESYPATQRWVLVVESDGEWTGLGWNRESFW